MTRPTRHHFGIQAELMKTPHGKAWGLERAPKPGTPLWIRKAREATARQHREDAAAIEREWLSGFIESYRLEAA